MEITDLESLKNNLNRSITAYAKLSIHIQRTRSYTSYFIGKAYQEIKEDIENKRDLEKIKHDILMEDADEEYIESTLSSLVVTLCSMFDAFLTDLETILILLDHRNKLNQVTIKTEDLIDSTPDEILLKCARKKARQNTGEGIARRIKNLNNHHNIKASIPKSEIEICERIFEKRNNFIHERFSFEKLEKDDSISISFIPDASETIHQAEKSFAKILNLLLSRVLTAKFHDKEMDALEILRHISSR